MEDELNLSELNTFFIDVVFNDTLKLKNVHFPVIKVYTECAMAYKENILVNEHETKIDSVVDYLHDELHTGHWSCIPLQLRQVYSAACVLKVIIFLKLLPEITINDLKLALNIIDKSILLGSPNDENFGYLSMFATRLSQVIYKANSKQLYQDVTNQSNLLEKEVNIEDNFLYNNLKAIEIDIKSKPTVTEFVNSYFTPQVPVKIQGSMFDWPACKKWKDIQYLLKIAGNRTVPVEIGSQYSDENWSQKLIKFEEFIKDFYLKESNEKGYLAQHNLFDQIPELFEDVAYPEYCLVPRNENLSSCEPDANVWFGPKGTISPLHYDPRDNMLTQVFGKKQVLLFSPNDSSYLYPHQSKLLFNTAQVDPLIPNYVEYPNFKKATMYKCLLGAGEMLYIPRNWWHHVTSLEKSFSVNFWWE